MVNSRHKRSGKIFRVDFRLTVDTDCLFGIESNAAMTADFLCLVVLHISEKKTMFFGRYEQPIVKVLGSVQKCNSFF